jgi:hypothetical protein
MPCFIVEEIIMTKPIRANEVASKPTAALELAINQLLSAIGGLEYGSIELTFHQGKLVQLEKREKTRLTKNDD